MGVFDNLMGLFSGDTTAKAEEQARQARAAGFSEASKYLQDYGAKAGQYFDAARGEWVPLEGGAQRGYDAYADASGANGIEGLMRAKGMFEAMPGYGGAISSSNDEIMRRFAGSGLTSNNAQAVSDNTANVINQKYGQYATALLPWLQQANTVAGGKAAADTGQAGLQFNMGTKIGDWRTGQATGDATGYEKEAEAKNAGGMSLLNSLLGVGKIAGSIFAPYAAPLLNAAGSGAFGGMTGGFMGSGSFQKP